MYTVPQFNQKFDLWTPGLVPSIDPATFVGLSGQMYYGYRDMGRGGGWLVPLSQVLVTEWRVPFDTFSSVIGVPIVGGVIGFPDGLGFNCYYYIIAWDYVHVGFPNQYMGILCVQCDDAGLVPDARR